MAVFGRRVAAEQGAGGVKTFSLGRVKQEIY